MQLCHSVSEHFGQVIVSNTDQIYIDINVKLTYTVIIVLMDNAIYICTNKLQISILQIVLTLTSIYFTEKKLLAI